MPVRSGGWTIGSVNGAVSLSSRIPSSAVEPNLRQRMPGLEAAVDRYIKGLRQHGRLAPDERTAWSVLDFTTGERLVAINEDIQLQAASLVKPFFALAFFHKVKEGRLIYGPRSRRHMERMIQRSNNKSSNWIMRHVGGPAAVQKILKLHYPAIFEDTRIVEYIPANGRTYRNKASVNDYSRFLSALWKEELPGSREIKRVMMLPGPDRLFTGASELPDGTTVYNKTGSTSRLCGDMGILVVEGEDGRSYPYTLIGVIEKQESARNYTSWIRSRADVIRDVSAIVYRGISQHHSLHSSL
jgi:beta-lactamase class A